MLRDLQVNNGRIPKYDKFWDLVNQKLEEMEAVDDRWNSHSNKDGLVVTNMAVAISAPDMHKNVRIQSLLQDSEKTKFQPCRHSSFIFCRKILSHILP